MERAKHSAGSKEANKADSGDAGVAPIEPSGIGYVIAVVAAALATGYLLTRWAGPSLHNRMLPWILGRSFGVAAYLCMVALVAMGLWFRHPRRSSLLHPATLLRSHVALAAATLVLTAGHGISLIVDPYAKLGIVGALVPGLAGYRPAAVALGTLGFYAALAAGLTASFAGSFAHRIWLPIHKVASVSVGLIWFHSVLAGTDTPSLSWLYASTGTALVGLSLSRYLSPRHPHAILSSTQSDGKRPA